MRRGLRAAMSCARAALNAGTAEHIPGSSPAPSHTLVIAATAAGLTAGGVSWSLAAEQSASPSGAIDFELPLANENTGKWRVYTDIGRDLALVGRLDEAERYLRSALECAKLGFGSDEDDHVGSALNNLAEVLRLQGRFSEAKPLYLEGIRILAASVGVNDVRFARACDHVAWFYLQIGQYKEAEAHFRIALGIVREQLPPCHPEVGAALVRVSEALRQQMRYPEAAALLRECLQVMEECGSGGTTRAVQRTARLVEVELLGGRHSYGKELAAIRAAVEGAQGGQHVAISSAADELALCLSKAARHEEARDLLDVVLKTRTAALARGHPLRGMTLRRLAAVDLAQGGSGAVEAAQGHVDSALDILQGAWEAAVSKRGSWWSWATSWLWSEAVAPPRPLHLAVELTEALLVASRVALACAPPGSERAEAFLRRAVRVLNEPCLQPSTPPQPPVAQKVAPGPARLGDAPAAEGAAMAGSPLKADPDELFDSQRRHSKVMAASRGLADERARQKQIARCLYTLVALLEDSDTGALRREEILGLQAEASLAQTRASS